MHEFRYYCLDRNNRILSGSDINAPDLSTAVRMAYEGCRSHSGTPSDRVEVWQGKRCLYTSDRSGEPRKDGG